MSFTLPKLTYHYDALEPSIDTMTMEIHHGKHHQGYVNNLNKAIEGTAYDQWPIEKIINHLQEIPENIRVSVRNNAGGHYNHSLFWASLCPGGSEMPKTLREDLINQFGSIEAFKDEFNQAALKRFGSGWAWLVEKDGKLEITSTANQDVPSYDGEYKELLGVDVWEHAYYLKYQNKRGDYLAAIWSVIDWNEVQARRA